MPKRLIYLSMMLVLLLSIGLPASAQVTTITLWHHSNVAWVDAWSTIVDRFEAENPDIKVEIEVLPDFGDRVLSAFAAGTEGDIIDMLGSMGLRYAREGLLQPVPASIASADQLEELFWPVTLASYAHDGEYYGIPYDFNVAGTGVVINLDMVEQAGLTIPGEWIETRQAGATFDELIEFAKQLAVVDDWGNVLVAGLAIINCHEHSDFLGMILQQGGEYLDWENQQVDFNTPEAANALGLIMEILDEHKLHSPYLPSRFTMFMEGTAAMTVGGPWYKAVIEREVEGLRFLRLNLPPFFAGANPYFPVKGGWGLTVSRRTDHPEEAWRFIEFAMQEDNMALINKTTGTVPTRMSLADDPRFDDEETLDIVEYARDMGAQLIVDIDQFIWLIITPEMEAVYHQAKTIEQALADMTRETNRLIEEIHK